MATDQDYQNWADWEDYQKSQTSPPPQPEPSIGQRIGSAVMDSIKDPSIVGPAGAYGASLGEQLVNEGPVATAKKVGSDVLEQGTGLAAAAGMAAAAPETGMVSALGIPAAYTAGQVAGRGVAEQFGLRKEQPGEYGAPSLAMKYLENAAIPGALEFGSRVANRGWLGAAVPGINPTGGIGKANMNADIAGQMGSQLDIGSSPGMSFSTPAGLSDLGGKVGGHQSIIESDPGVIKTGFYGGGQQIDLNSGSPTFGQFVPGEGGAVNKTAVEAQYTLKTQLPRMMEARDQMVTQYDNALPILKQNQPGFEGISPNNILYVPLNQQQPGLSDALDTLVAQKRLSGVSDQTANVLENEAANIKHAALSQGEYAPGQALKVIQDLDSSIEALGGWEKNPNAEQGKIDAAKIEMYKTARVYWKQAFDDSIGAIYNMSNLTPAAGQLPHFGDIQTLNDAWSSLQPVTRQLDHFAQQFSTLAQGAVLPGMPNTDSATKLSLSPTSVYSVPSRLLSKAVEWFQDPQQKLFDYHQQLLDANQNAFKNAQARAQGAGIPVTQPAANYLGGSSGALAASAGSGFAQSTQQRDYQGQPNKSAVAVPSALSVPLTPPPANPKAGFTIPRNLNAMDPQGVANLITSVAPPQDAQPLVYQWQRLVAAGDKRQQAQFLGMLSDAHPDLPLARGAVTGLASEFDLGDGRPRLFTPTDKAKWEESINNSNLRSDEKAQRILALRKDGLVIPFTTRVGPPAQPGASGFQFGGRQQTTTGSRRIEQ